MNKLTKILSMVVVAITVSASSAAAMCQVEEVDMWGDVTMTYSKNSCERAMRVCERNKDWGSDCQIDRRGGRTQVQRECTVYENSRWSVERTFSAQATGRRGNGIKAKACRKALRKCERNKSYYNDCSKVAKDRRDGPGQGRGRQHVRTFTYAGRSMGDAIRTCQQERRLMPRCSRAQMRCTPCSGEGRGRASFDLYRMRR